MPAGEASTERSRSVPSPRAASTIRRVTIAWETRITVSPSCSAISSARAPATREGAAATVVPPWRPAPPGAPRPGLGLLGKAHHDFGPGQPGPGPEIHLAEGRLQADSQLVRRGNTLRSRPRAHYWD